MPLGGCVLWQHVVQVELGKVLGAGTFGTTYLGRWRGGNVAVKCVQIKQRNEAESFLREVDVLSRVRHPNVMPFYGMSGCTNIKDIIMPVSM